MTNQHFREMSALARLAEELGCRVRMTNAGHWKVYTPSGQMIVMAATPSDRRAIKNATSRLRRAGVRV